MGREFELKYRLTLEQLAILEKTCAPFNTLHMETVYYDTPSGELGKRRWTLRRRMENSNPVCTMKTSAQDGARGEWEIAWEDILTAPERLAALGAPAELPAITAEGLIPTCGARFTRLAAPIHHGDSLLELALDQGVLINGTTEIPFAELEVELKEGSDDDARTFAETLADTYGLTPEPKSKFYRALHAGE